MKIIFMGPQGSGKTTQAELLAKKLGVPHLQTGEFYRQLAQKEDSPFGRRVKELLSQGKLVPDKEHNQIFKEELSKPEYKEGFVFDGSPRTRHQAETLPFEPDRIFYLVVSDKEDIKRLTKRGRFDDTPELIAERLKIFHEVTDPVLDFYRQKGVLEEVDGERPIEVIFEDVWSRINHV